MSRLRVATLALSAAGLVGIVSHESFTSTAVIPIPGDRPTYGFGNTFKADGSPVKMGDTITPPKAVRLAVDHIAKDEAVLRKCITAPMYQHEYDAYVSLTYNIGHVAFCNSTLVEKLNTLDYAGACREILRWDKFKGKQVRGLANRRTDEFKRCVGAPLAAPD